MVRTLRDVGSREDSVQETTGKVKPRAVPHEDDEDEEPKKKTVGEIIAPEFELTTLHNGQLEYASLVEMLFDPTLRGRLWPRYTEGHFASEVGKDIFNRLKALEAAGNDWPSLGSLAMDPVLKGAPQQMLTMTVERINRGHSHRPDAVTLTNGTQVPLQSTADFEGYIFNLLEAYRITREAMEIITDAATKLGDEQSFDPLTGPEMVEKIALGIMGLRGRESLTEALLHFGYRLTKEDKAKQKTELDKLFNRNRLQFKTGFAEFDQRSGGFQPGEVVLLGANTGAGKSAMALTMMTNMARMGTSVAMCQLELTMEQVDGRQAANLANINSEVIRNNRCTQDQEDRIREAWEMFHEELDGLQTRWTIYAPSSATIQDCEYVFKTFKYGVWFIDYVNLIDRQQNGGSGKFQSGEDWMRLSDIVKDFKRLAKKYGIAIVLLVQINVNSETGDIEIRYAKAMKEHSDIVIVWHLNKEARDEGCVWLRHLKARQYEPFDFAVRVALEYCRFESLSPNEIPSLEERKLVGRKKLKPADKKKPVEESRFKKKAAPLVVEVEDVQEDLPPPTSRHQSRAVVADDEAAYEEFDA